MSDIAGRRPSSRHFKQRWRDSQRFKKISDSEILEAIDLNTKEEMKLEASDKVRKTPAEISQDTLLQEYLDYTTDLAIKACGKSKTMDAVFARAATERTKFKHRKLHQELASEKLLPKVRELLNISESEIEKNLFEKDRSKESKKPLSYEEMETREFLLKGKNRMRKTKDENPLKTDLEKAQKEQSLKILKAKNIKNTIAKLKDMRQAHIEDSLETQMALTPEIAASLAKEIAKNRQNSIKPASEKRAG